MPVIRIPVVVVGVLAVLAVGGVLLWGGGDPPEAASASGAPGFASSGSASGSATASPDSVSPPPFNPADVAPIGGQPITPTETQAILAWRVSSQDWSAVLSVYQGFLAAPGYRLGEQRITTTDGETGAPKGGAWDIVADPGNGVAVGLLYIGPDPADPGSTIVEVEVS